MEEIPTKYVSYKDLKKLMAESGNLFQISRSCATSDLYDQYDRRIQSSAPEGDEIKNRLSFGRQPAEDAVSGEDRYYKEMDGAPPGLGADPFPAGNLF